MQDERERLENMITNCEFEKVKKCLKEFEKKLSMDDNVNRQFVKRLSALVEYGLDRSDLKKIREDLSEALRCTIPEYKEGIVPKGVFTRYEIRLFCNIAVTYAEEERYEDAVSILQQLVAYFSKTKVDQEERAVSEVLVLSNLAQVLGRMGETKEAGKIGERAKELCIRMDQVGMLPNIIYNIAFGKELIGDSKEICQETLLQAYYMADLCGHTKIMQHINEHINKVYQEDLTCCTDIMANNIANNLKL